MDQKKGEDSRRQYDAMRRRIINRNISIGEMPRCDKSIIKLGKRVSICAFGKDAAEAWCKDMRKRGFRVDWYFSSRRVPIIATLDDITTIKEMWNQHSNKLRRIGY